MSAIRILKAAALALATAAPPAHPDRLKERELMVMTVESLAAIAGPAEARRIDSDVLRAMRSVPRHLLVPEEERANAYENRPLAIGYEATISQPYVVALMTHLLKPEADDVMLEVGTGSGYQAAVLSTLVRRVYSIEIVEPLATRAAADLARLGYDNVIVRAGDGYAGWPEQAPFDGIIVTAGAPQVPQPLLDQLKLGGRMVMPVDIAPGRQMLTLVEKNRSGRIRTRKVMEVAFVPLVRGGARASDGR